MSDNEPQAPQAPVGAGVREYARVDIECPSKFRIVARDHSAQTEGAEALAESRQPTFSIPLTPPGDSFELLKEGDPSTARIMEVLLWVDWKLSFLVRHLTRQADTERFPYSGVILNLSASGMRFVTDHMVDPGEVLEFEFVLPVVPYAETHLIGEVIRSYQRIIDGASKVECSVKFRFAKTQDSDQELITRFVVQRQLQLQRGRRA